MNYPCDKTRRESEQGVWWREWCASSKRYSSLFWSIEATADDLEKMEHTGTATPELENAFEERLGL